jgi:protein SCO1/2
MPGFRHSLFAAAILALAAALGAYAWLWPRAGHAPVTVGEALVGGAFAMTDEQGRRVSDKDFLGKHMLVFFGYTYCPDVCPTELHVMAAALAELGEDQHKLRLVFVTIDPERDTPEVMKSYVSAFGPQMTGLTGTPEDVARIARAYRVFYRKVPMGSDGDYRMDHTSLVYLMGPDGRFVTYFNYSTDAKALAEGLRAALAGSS